jgi:hypothetical protein
MCSLQNTLGAGRAMKAKTYACYCCNVHRNNLAKPLDIPCEDCVRLGHTQPFYNTYISDKALIERLIEERDDIQPS